MLNQAHIVGDYKNKLHVNGLNKFILISCTKLFHTMSLNEDEQV